MIIRSFLDWYDVAAPAGRVEAVQMMVRSYLAGELGSDTPQEAESALTLVLDDASISVRSALAWELALSDRAPRHLLIALAHDEAEVASFVLARSPQLTEADLMDCARHGDALTHLAIAMREHVSSSLAHALAQTAGARALSGMLENTGAEIAPETFRLMMQRHGGDGALREGLNARNDLPPDVRQSLVSAVSADLLNLVCERGWIADRRAERCIEDARDAATTELACEADDLGRFVAHLGTSNQLTPSVLLRSLLGGDASLFGAALVQLSGVRASRVAGMLSGRATGLLAATCTKAGLPAPMVPVFTAALTAINTSKRTEQGETRQLQRRIIGQVLAACMHEDQDALRSVIAMLRRLDAEMAREDARAERERLKLAPAPVFDAEIAVPALAEWPTTIESHGMEAEHPEMQVGAPTIGYDIVNETTGADARPAPRRFEAALEMGRGFVSRFIRKPAAPVRTPLPDDLERLLAEALSEELELRPALTVIESQDHAFDSDYFTTNRPNTRAGMAA